ncbi:MAG: ABC transporter permease [Christensenellaceae bacterium]|jgi:ribose transport system permease protein
MENNMEKQGFFKKHNIKISDFSVLLALIVLMLVFGLVNNAFFSGDNIMNIFYQAAINGIVAVGMTFVIITGGIDLSVGSVAAVSVVVIGLTKSIAGEYTPASGIISIIFALGIGCLLGAVNGIAITKGKLPPFIATLGMMSIARGMALVLTGGRPIGDLPPLVRTLGSAKIGGLYVAIIVMIIVFVVAFWGLKYTWQGRSTYAIGGNKEASRLSGINVNKTVLITYIISGFCAGLAAVLMGGKLNSANPTSGTEYEMDAIAASVIGGVSMSGGEGGVIGTFIGAVLISTLRNGLNILGVSSYWQQIVIGAVIIFAVMADALRKKK